MIKLSVADVKIFQSRDFFGDASVDDINKEAVDYTKKHPFEPKRGLFTEF